MKKNLTMQLMPLWLLAFFFFASVPIKAQTNSEATPRVGIVKLIGCGTGNEANKAQIQVMHDGTGYSYNFGANASARSGNTAWVPAGTRTITVTKGSRVYSLPITVPDKVVPTFTPTITYNCNGTADVLLTNNQGTYNYTYTYGSKTDNSPYFKSLAVGQHTITVKYTPPVTTEKRVVFYDDFGTYNGETAKSSFSPYVNRNVFFDPLDGSGVQRRPVDNATRTAGIGTDSAYCIARRQDVLNGIPTVDLPNPIPTWLIPEDKDKEANGKFLWYNVEHSVGDKFIVYKRKAAVKANAFFDFRASVYNPVYEYASSNPYVDMKPVMQLLVYKTEADAAANVNVLYASYSLNVPKATKKDDWYTLDVSGHTGTNTELVFVIRMFNITSGPNRAIGNDVAIDNILVTQPSDSCEQTISVPVNVVTDTKTFSTTVVYNCAAGTGNITITPTVTTGYEYTYSLDGSTPQTSNTFNNATVGVHTLTITYKNTGAKTLFKEDFGTGASYSLPRSVVPEPFVYRPDGAGYPGDVLQEGDYRVANHDNLIWMPSWGWKPVKSHGDNSNTGRFLAFNYGPNANKTFYQQDIQVEPNKLVTLEYYALNIDAPSNLPNIRATFINKATNATITTYDSGALPGRTSATYSPNDWQKITHTFNPGSATTIQLRFTNLNNNTGSNDFAIDDILVTQAYDTCTTTLTATVAPKVTNAFAGVTKLIGCGTGANASKAEVTIANVQGGTGAYEYNFDGTWVATNTGWLAAGTHTVSVRAAGTGNSCQYDMSVTVPAALVQPTIKTEVFYACDGRPTLKIGVQDPDPELTYMYSLDGGAYTTTYVYSNIATGTHQVSVQYEYRSAPSPVMLLQQNFGSGARTNLPAEETPLTFGVGVGAYEVTNPNQYNAMYVPNTSAGYGKRMLSLTCAANHVWVPVPDHTSGGTDPNGRFFLTNSQSTLSTGDVFYRKKVTNIAPNSDIKWEFFILNLFREDEKMGGGVPAIKPNIRVVLLANDNSEIDFINTGEVPYSICGAGLNNWHKYEGVLNSGNHTEFTIEFRSNANTAHSWGNDFAIDDITVYQVPKACGQVVSATTNVTTNPLGVPTFTANVSNCSNTNSTITWVASPTTGYTYTYTLQGGTATSSNVFSGLATGTYTFTVNYCGTTDTSTIIFKEDFGAGNITSSPYVPMYDVTKANTPNEGYRYISNADLQGIEGGYAVTPAVLLQNALWQNPVDKSGKTNGRFLAFNIGKGEVIYKREIQVIPNRNLKFEFYIFNFEKASNHRNVGRPNIKMSLLTTSGTVIASKTSGEVTENTGANDWRKFEGSLNTGNNNTVILEIRTLTSNPVGNDMAIDDIIITQEPIICTTTVTATIANQVQNAFAGVTKLIGCGTGANANNAEVTIANVEGGSGNYEYSFDGITWTASNTGWLPVGTHTVSVRDGITKSCAYDMSVTVPAALAQPTIKTEVFYACDGKAILNIGVENPDPELTYMYSLDGAAFTTTYVYTNVASGTHSVSVQYEHRNAPSPVMLLKETFGSGPKTDLPAGVTSFTYGTLFNEGEYEVNNYDNVKTLSPSHFGTGCASYNWVEVVDHTSGGTDSQGRVFMTNAKTHSSIGDLFYKKKVKDIVPNSEIKYEFYILNLFREDRKYFPGSSTSTNPPPGTPDDALKPNIKIRLVATDGTEIDVKTTGEIPNSICGAGLANWRKIEGTLNSGNNTEFTIEFRSNGANTHGWGDDFCIDDIIVYQVPNACGQVVSTTKVVTANNQDIPAFTVSKTYDCATGKGALTVTPTATTGFTYTYTLGSTTYTGTTATFTGLDLEQTYTVSISYQAVSNTVTLLNEDFGVGTTPTQAVKSPYTAKDLYFNENKAATYNAYNANGQFHNHPISSGLQEAEYTIANGFAESFSAWVVPTDHSGKPNGRIFFVNPPQSATPQPLYMREVNVLPNKELTFSAQFFNLFNNVGTEPKIQLLVFDSKAAYEANSNASAAVKASPITTVQVNGGSATAWKEHKLTLTATEVGARSSVFVVVRMDNPQSNGHDLAMDDIKVTQKLLACTTSVIATLTKGDVVTPTLTLPANLSVICSAPTASATISSWIASATATSTCGTATVTHNYTYPSNLCNVSGGAVTVTFSTTDPFGNVVTATRVISFATMTLTVTPTTLSVPNGALGGTTSSVVPNITLGGVASPSTNSVTITFSGLPTGVTSTTGGRLIVAPNTPAGSHTITYTVCETAGHNNCKTVNTQLVIGTGSLTVTPVTPLTVPNGISGGTTSSVLTGITLNGTTVTNTNSVTISFSGLPAGVTTNTNGQLVIPAGTPAGAHTITYKVCEKLNPTNCQTVTSTLVIGTGSLTVTPVTPLTVPNGANGGTTSSVLTGVRLNGNVVTNTNSVTISFSGLPTGVTTDTQGRIVVPAGTPATSTLVTYKVCEKLNPTNCHTVTSTLVIGTGSLTVTPVTPLTVPNGISGGTTSSVLTGITLNGATVTNTNSVTISFSGLPTGVTTNTNGQLVIPAGTPAGTHTITYKVCEKLNPTNCHTVTSTLVIGTGSLTVTPVTPLTVPNGISGGTTSSVLTGITLNGATVTNTNSVTISFSGLPAGVTTNTNGQLVIPAGTPAGTHTITYKVCEKLNPTNCHTVTSTLVIGTGSLTVTPVTPLTVPNGISGGTTSSVLTGITLNGATVTNTNSVTISFSGLPAGVTTNTNGQLVIPAGTPAGTHTITYKVCEKLNPTNCQTVTSTLVIGTGSLTVTSTTLTHPNGTQGGTTTGTVLTGVKINGNPVNTASVTITWNSLPPNATGNASGTVTIAPNTPAGTYTISYTVCERLNGNSNCQSVTSQITIGGGSLTATSTNLTHPNGTQGGTTTGTVLTGVKINGNPVNTASVTITWNSLPPNATGNASGTVTIAPNTPAGTYTISYTVCERLNGNSNCQSVTSQITIGGGSLTATPTNLIVANGATGGTSVNNVLTGVKINGNPVNTNSVTITWNSLPPGFTGTNSGTVTVPANTPAGTYTVTYTVCERLNSNSNCKTVSSTIIVGNGSMIVVPTPITVPNGTIGGTSTPSVLTGVVLNGNSNPAPNTVSITWNSLPPRATGNNDGTVNVAPNTPAGTYTVSYTICEALNNGHCTTVTSSITIGGGVLTVTPVTTLTVANGAQGGTTTSSVLTGVSLNGQPANSQSVTITFSGLPAGVTSNTNGQLVVAPGTPATNTTIYYTVCETLNANNNCHTYSTTLVIGTPNLSVTPRTYAIPDATVGGTTSSVLETVTIDGHTPSSQSVTITFGNLPVGIQTTTSGGFRVPAGTPTGIHTVTYTVCEVLNPDHCVTSIATIAVGNVPVVTPNAFTYTGTATVTTPSILDDDTVGTQSATTGTGGNVVINITSTPTGTVVPSLDANNGRVTIPAGTPPGIYTITYDVCTTATPTACTPEAVVITIPNVPVITPDDMVYTDTTTTTAGNILTNDRVGTQSATAGNGGNVSITVTIPATPKAPGATVPTLNPNTGVVTVPAGTPSGTYTITYKICTTATPTSCDTGVVTITVSGTVTEAPDTNDVTAYTRINTPVTVGVTSSTTVTVSIPSQPANGTAVSNGDGTITYTPNNGFKGTDSFEYSLCNAAGCRTATISVRVTSELIIYNGVSIGGSDKNNHFHIEGIENYPNNTVRIYNRWGVKVFEMSGYNNTTKAFRGVSDARATLEASDNLPQGTYYYIIEYVDEHNKTQTETGWLYLKKN